MTTTVNSKNPFVGEREIAEILDLDGRQIAGLIRSGYGTALAGAVTARRLRRPVPAGWDEFIKSCTQITWPAAQTHRRPALHGVRAIAAETGVDSRMIAMLAREGQQRTIWSLILVEQRRRRAKVQRSR